MFLPLKLSSPATHEYWEIPVLFEDDHLLALDKPAGLLTSPNHRDPSRPSLMALLHVAIRANTSWAKAHALAYLANAHRLEGEASGVVLLARGKPVLIALANLFGGGKTTRTFLALVEGTPPEPRFEVEAKLAPHPAQLGLMRVDPKRGKKALTTFHVEETFAGYTLLRCVPRVGPLHQIRAHLQFSRLPIVADASYGGHPLWLSRLKPGYRLKPGRQERPLMGRVALHALGLDLLHPVTGVALNLTAPWPKDLRVAVKYLRQFAPAVPPPTLEGSSPTESCLSAERPAPDAALPTSGESSD